jgi:hypothetical protein
MIHIFKCLPVVRPRTFACEKLEPALCHYWYFGGIPFQYAIDLIKHKKRDNENDRIGYGYHVDDRSTAVKEA